MTKAKSIQIVKNKDSDIISAKEAAIAARNFYKEVTDVEPSRITLEEISLGESKSNWYVTLGIYTATDNPVLLAQGLKDLLNYKQFKIDAKTGKVLSMDIKFIKFPQFQNA